MNNITPHVLKISTTHVWWCPKASEAQVVIDSCRQLPLILTLVKPLLMAYRWMSIGNLQNDISSSSSSSSSSSYVIIVLKHIDKMTDLSCDVLCPSFSHYHYHGEHVYFFWTLSPPRNIAIPMTYSHRSPRSPRRHAVGGLEAHAIDGDFHLPRDRTQGRLHLHNAGPFGVRICLGIEMVCFSCQTSRVVHLWPISIMDLYIYIYDIYIYIYDIYIYMIYIYIVYIYTYIYIWILNGILTGFIYEWRSTFSGWDAKKTHRYHRFKTSISSTYPARKRKNMEKHPYHRFTQPKKIRASRCPLLPTTAHRSGRRPWWWHRAAPRWRRRWSAKRRPTICWPSLQRSPSATPEPESRREHLRKNRRENQCDTYYISHRIQSYRMVYIW